MISTFGRRESTFVIMFSRETKIFNRTENFLLIICGSIPTLKPLYDMVLQHAKSALSGVSGHTPGKSYASDSTPKRSHRMSLDPRMASRSYRIGSKDQSFGMSTKIDGGPVAREDGWNNDDNHALLEMGDITVNSRLEVTRERRGSDHVPITRVVTKPAPVRTAIIPGDNMV